MAGTTHTGRLRVLVLGSSPELDACLAGLSGKTATERVSTFEEVLEALQARPFDLVLSRAADFIPFQGIHFSRHAQAIIDSVSHGIGIVGRDGELVWANPRLLSYPDSVRERVRQFCLETFSWAESAGKSTPSEVRGRRFHFAAEGNRRYELTATPVIDLHHRVTQVAVVVWDATSAGRLEDKVEAIDRAGRELLSLDAAQFSRLDPQERLSLLEQKILRCTKELLHFDNFEVRVIDRETGRLETALSSGIPPDPPGVELYVGAEGNGICGYVAARGRSYICPDTRRDPRYIRGVEGALSSLTVPLWLHDKVVGVANFESRKLAAFTEDDRQFAEIFGRYIALSLHVLELLASERRTTTGQLGSDVMAQITGPLNDILTDVENLVEDYIGHDDLRHRLRKISENCVQIRDRIKELTTSRPGLLGAGLRRTVQHDPTLAGKRVLVAEDEPVLRETVRDVLTGYGCHVCTAEDGAAAVEAISQQAFDLVLSDIKMPHRNGYEVFAAAKETNPDIPVILTTGFGYDPNHSIIRARREGLSAVLFKPFKVDQLLNEIRSALRSARSSADS
ncbi:MAG: response regulator [Planctomycetota bacterium]|nr:MAG: response regulator [Planctomycetota bacterium]